MDILEQVKLTNILKQHRGVKNAIKKRDLLKEMFGIETAEDESYNNVDDRKLREMIEELNNEHGGLICSSSTAGYYWAEDLKEGLAAVEAAKRRAATQMHNASSLEKNLQDAFGGQLGLL